MSRNLSLLLAVFGAAAALTTSGAIAAARATVVSEPATQAIDGAQILAREASEGPRGADNERPGDRQRRNRGGRGVIEEQRNDVLAREASEGPRGGDNERPGDRQRRNRGGRG